MTTSVSNYEYSHIIANGVDHRLIAKICALTIVNQFGVKTLQCPSEDKLQSFIASVIYRSGLGVGVTVSAMTFVERFQGVLLQGVAGHMDVSCRTFLVCYMVAAKLMFNNKLTLVFWKRVVEREYDCADLSKLECNFYKTMEWDVKIDEEAFAQCFRNLIASYRGFVEDCTLLASPPPTYQPEAFHHRKARVGGSLPEAEAQTICTLA